jgi:hypothetical protein
MNIFLKPALAAAALAGAVAVGGCTDYGYGGYGYGGVSTGYAAAYGDPYWGWNDDYYYPGTGVYVYDQGRRRHRWNDAQRGYWEGRRGSWRGERRWRNNWRDFRRR